MLYNEYSSGTTILMDAYASRGAQALRVRSGAFGLDDAASGADAPAATVFLRCDAEHPLDDLPEPIRVWPSQGVIRTARVPLSQMALVAQHPAVHRIQVARYLHPKLDRALPRIAVPQFRERTQAKGAGVVIGIVDSGIDGSHPSFAGRILRVLDQTQRGEIPEGRGVELMGEEIAALSRDEKGHGTHVAGIAGGALLPFEGVAPAADLIVVKTTFQDAHVAQGVRYLSRVIREMGRPGVINLSLGSHLDPHDGSDELSYVINESSGPGLIVCCAAGNERATGIHARAVVHLDQVARIQFEMPGRRSLGILNGWYSGNDEIEIAIESPAGDRTPFHGPLRAGQPAQVFRHIVGSSVVSISTPGPNRNNGDHHIHIQIEPRGSQPTAAAEVWTILLLGRSVGNGRVDLWSNDADGGPGAPFRSNATDEMLVGMPGCAAEAITVGCFASRKFYVSDDGSIRTGPEQENVLSPESSPGPLRNGNPKPDLVAPGNLLISSLSAQSSVDVGITVGGQFKVDQGSSMSTAMVSGLVALMLSRSASLTPAQAKARLNAACSIPGAAPGAFDNVWGSGLIDANRL